jgi:hypothetical protein
MFGVLLRHSSTRAYDFLMNYLPNLGDAYRMMPGPAGEPALRGMVPDLPDIGWREPPSAAVFGGISLVHEAAAISASAAYPSPAADRGGDHAKGGQGGSSRDHRSPPTGVLCSIGCSAPSTRRSTAMSGRKCSQPGA